MKLFRVAFLLFFSLSACLITSSCSVFNGGKPANEGANPASDQNGACSDPTRDPNKAVVQGRLLLNGKPYTQGVIYFSPTIKDKAGNDIIVGLDRQSLLRDYLDTNGNFKIWNIPPGKYGIVLDLITHGALLNYPDKEQTYIVDITKGQNLNLGDLNYSNLPTP